MNNNAINVIGLKTMISIILPAASIPVYTNSLPIKVNNSSIAIISLVNLFIILPVGFESKNLVVVQTTRSIA